jgi:hypothetical protein
MKILSEFYGTLNLLFMKNNLSPDTGMYPCEWIDAQEMMQELNLRPRSMKHYRDNGVFVYSTFGGKILYCKTCVLRTLHECKVGGCKEPFPFRCGKRVDEPGENDGKQE